MTAKTTHSSDTQSNRRARLVLKDLFFCRGTDHMRVFVEKIAAWGEKKNRVLQTAGGVYTRIGHSTYYILAKKDVALLILPTLH